MTATQNTAAPIVIPAEPENSVPLVGTIFGKDTVMLPGEDDTQREMGVLWIKDAETGKLVRVTDFSGMHRDLETDASVKLVVSLSTQVRDGQPAKEHRNLVTVIPAQG